MKQYKPYLFGALLMVLFFASFSFGTAYATTGCFPDTNGHWAETFICWLKDNGISSGYGDGTYKPENSVTRAEMSVFLQKVFNLADASAQSKANTAQTNAIASAQASANTAETNAKAYADLLVNEPPSTGEIRINSGPISWGKYGNQPGTLTIYGHDEYIGITSSVANTNEGFIMTPSFPSGLYGRKLNVTGMEYCYTANANAYISNIQSYHNNETSGAEATSYTYLVQDFTVRTDAACRYYSITPQALDDNSILSVYLGLSWGPAGAGTQIKLGRVTFFFQPTTAAVPAPQTLELIPPASPDETKPINP